MNLKAKIEYEVVEFERVKGKDHFVFLEVACDPRGEEFDVGIETIIPGIRVVCDRCNGRGVHDHPAFSNGITSSEWENDWDADSRESYMRGHYDVRCEKCNGDNVVLEPDFENLEYHVADDEALKRFWAYLEERRRDEAEVRHERAMGY